MKKVLSFVLVLAMILGSFATAFATINDTVVTKDNTAVPFPDAQDSGVATVLRDLGALKGNEAGLVNLKGTLTRAEAATIVVRALGLEDLGKVPTATKFKDVPADAWYSGYVAQAVAAGAMKGQSDTTFAPLAEITLDECVALVAQTLGYDGAHLVGSWPANYRNVARQVGFLGTVAVGTANATRADLCNLIYNALKCNKVEWVDKVEGGYVGANANNVQYTFAGETLFESITGVGNKAIEAVYTSAATGVVTAETKFANGFDASAFYGKKVYFLQKANKAGKFENIGVWKLDTTTLAGKFSPQRGVTGSFDKFVVGDTEYKFSLSTATDLTTIGAAYFTGNNYIYENGTTVASVVLNKDLTYEIDVTFADAAKTKIAAVESISYWRASEAAVVNATQAALLADGDIVKLNASANKLGTYGFATTKASVTSTKNVYLAGSCVVEGAVTDLADIEEDDVVELFYGKVEGKNALVKVVVTRNKVVGTIAVVDGTTLTVNGTAYKISSITAGATAIGTPKAASEFALWLDSNGKYVQAELATEKATPDYLYAFITGYKPVKADEGEKVKTDVTFASIWLTVPGQDEVLYSSAKCLTGTAVEGSYADNKFTPGAFVKYTLKNGELSSITTVAFETIGTTNITVSATGFIDGKKLTADTKVYKVVSTVGVEYSKDTNYVELSLDDIKGRSFAQADFAYATDAVTKTVTFVVVNGSGTATGDVTYITGAAFLKATYNPTTKKYDAKFITVEGEKTLAVNTKPTNKVTEVGILKLTLGEFTAFNAATNTDILVDDNRATVEAITLVDGVLTVGDDVYFVADDAKTWVYDDTAVAKGFVEKDFEDAQDDLYAQTVYGFDFNDDGAYDLLVVSVYVSTNPLADWNN